MEMQLHRLDSLVCFELAGLTLALAVIVIWQCCSGMISLSGLLKNPSGRLSTARVQLLAGTIVAAIMQLLWPKGLSPASQIAVALLTSSSNLVYIARVHILRRG